MPEAKSLRVWDASECALMFIDYQDHVFDVIFAQDRRVIELNTRTLAKMAVAFNIPVILSTVGVEMGANGPTMASLRAILPNVKDIDRSTMNAWGDPKFVAAVKATGRKRLVMCGISTSACLTYPVVSALADGYEVTFIEDAVGDSSRQQHDTAVLRLAHAGAIPNTTVGMIAEWFLDWKLPIANEWRKVAVPYYDDIAALQRAPECRTPQGLTVKRHASAT
jgi:nicotinamidase-related amidase